MKKFVSILVLACAPALAFAAGEHSGGHSMGGHTMSGMSGIGKPGDPAKVSRTIEVVMDDTMQFTPAQIDVKAGETIRFFIKNTGKLQHEMVIGTLADLKAHAEEMKKMPGMQHVEPNMITLNAGQRGGLVWTFDQAGTVDFACLIPGHMEAGMVGKVNVN
ncbi:cupredoxin domain-containing protein [Neopusillimonas aromaticivorans]|uniref:cupredoxin domain-containing protein n=1 Tax=Neopusillimonas aromaticivorans TaxID=2979868 RepID=UPI002597C3CA|nr:cupredoxin family protein [Neopusillimonas aromaticivorans]WJJ93239.1 cupredoxin family protein [Neopusillimonas aromaticivorans]